ncbi:hypothetical protein, partial [uncultured Oscillibacter sp.]|uniref:hypothetical protein n=1 Tax=uncultured Oscillibacter sp. TaxID=876091 RepID=UPI002631B48C
APFDRAGTGKARNSSPNMALYWSFPLPLSVCLAFTGFNQCFLYSVIWVRTKMNASLFEPTPLDQIR